MAEQPDIDIVFVAYRSERWVRTCFEALARIEYPPDRLHLTLVENSPDDPSVAAARGWWAEFETNHGRQPFASISFLEPGRNLGCAGGNNLGWREGRSPFVLFLNLDTEVTPGFLGPLVETLIARPRAAFAGPKIYFPSSRKLQHAGGVIYGNGMADHYFNCEEDRGQADRPRCVNFVTGACMLARRSALEELHGFDEDFNPAYYEETDLCWRARKAGWTIRYVPESLIYHHESAALGGRTDDRFLRAIYRSRMRFVLKHWTLADFFERWLPSERWWFGIVESESARPYQIRSYIQALTFLLVKQRNIGRSSGGSTG